MGNGGEEPKELFGQAFGRRPDAANGPAPQEPAEPEALDLETRLKLLKRPFWIGYDRAVQIRARIKDLLDTPYSDRVTSCAVIAPSYNGKTSILRNVQRRHNLLPPDYQQSPSRPEIKIPVFFMQAPPVPDEDRLLDAVLRLLSIQGSPREPTEHKISRIQAVFVGLGVKLLAIDEFGFYQAGTGRAIEPSIRAHQGAASVVRLPVHRSVETVSLDVRQKPSELGELGR
jgi:hypothetical protein